MAHDEYNVLRNQLCKEISLINSVSNVIGQGRDDLDASVLVAADEVCRKVSASQSSAIRQLADKIQKSFTTVRRLFADRYAPNVEVVDP